ncbi:hypothetical protein D3C80_1383600 [compost metagenome]
MAAFSAIVWPALCGASSKRPSATAPRAAPVATRRATPPSTPSAMIFASARSPMPPNAPVTTPAVIRACVCASLLTASMACCSDMPLSTSCLTASDCTSCSRGISAIFWRTEFAASAPPSKPSVMPPASVAVFAAVAAATSLDAPPASVVTKAPRAMMPDGSMLATVDGPLSAMTPR